MAGKPPKRWIKGAVKRPGRLHRYFNIPENETIPVARLEELARGKNKSLAAAARLALRLRKMKKR